MPRPCKNNPDGTSQPINHIRPRSGRLLAQPFCSTTYRIDPEKSVTGPITLYNPSSLPLVCISCLIVAFRRALVVIARTSAVVIVSLAERGEALLLGDGVDICSNDESNHIEEGDPRMLWKELLGKGQGQWRRDPANLHDGHESSFPGRSNLVNIGGSGNECHGYEIYSVLDRCNLVTTISLGQGASFLMTYNEIAEEDL